MAAPALTAATGSLTFLVVGAATHLATTNDKPFQTKMFLRRGGFIGVINGRGAAAPPSDSTSRSAPAPADAPASAPKKKIHPIGGMTDKPMPPSPFRKFPKHRPSKLPGPPKPYDSKSP